MSLPPDNEYLAIPSPGTGDTDGLNPKDIAAQTRAPLHLLPAVTLIHGAMACKDGAAKYNAYNWREKPISLMEYLGAIERHIARIKDGENVDAKSGVTHLGHIIATAGILLDANAVGTLKDDRPKIGGIATKLLDRIEGNIPYNPWSPRQQRLPLPMELPSEMFTSPRR